MTIFFLCAVDEPAMKTLTTTNGHYPQSKSKIEEINHDGKKTN